MNKYFLLLFLLSYLCGCSKNIANFKNNKFNIIKLGDQKSLVETKLGNAIKCEKNEDGSLIITYELNNYKDLINNKIYKKIIILYNNNLSVTHFILD